MASIAQEIKDISFDRALRIATAGLVVGFGEVVYTISLVTLVFQGELTGALPLAIGIGLVTQIVHMLCVALFSKTSGLIASVQDNSSALIAVSVAAIVARVTPQIQFATVMMFIIATTTITGLSLFLIGQLRLGQLGRYIPYPVIAGFLAGTGWLLIQGSFGSMGNLSLTIANIPALLQADALLLWIPGVLFGGVLFFSMRRFTHPRTMPFLLLASMVIFYVVLMLTNTTIAQATQHGLLLSQNNAMYWQLPQVDNFSQADWSAISSQMGNVAAIVILTVLSLMLKLSALEVMLKTDIDLNHELRTAGIANIIGGAMGGLIGFHGISFTTMSQRIAGRERLVSVLTAIFAFAVLLFGSGLLEYMPRFVLGGLIFYLGLDFLNEWLIVSRKQFARLDYSIVLLIVFSIIFAGFLIGVALGLVLMIILFVWNYSRISIYHYRSSGAETTSNVQRTGYHQESLQRLGQHTEIMELRGFIFFGTVNHLLELVRQRYQAEQQPQLSYLVLDFRRVTGIDSSAIMGFQKLRHIALTNNFTVLFTQLPEATQHHFVDEGIDQPDDHIHAFPDLDHALEWCENALLEVSGVTQARVSVMLEGQLEEQGFDVKQVKPLRQYLERRVVDKGEYLMRQGEDATDLYFIEIGQVSVVLELPDNQTIRLRTMQMGTVVGEVGFYLKQKRSASIVADTKAIAYRLSQEALTRMKEEQPQLAIALDEMMIRIVAERLARNNRAIEAYSR